MNLISTLTISAALAFLLGSCQEKIPTFKIPEGHVGMFGYGSLMSKKLIETGLLDKTYDGPYLPAHLKGYKRSWTFAWPTDIPLYNVDSTFSKDYILVEGDTIFPNYLNYLNIQEDSNTDINGVLYIVPEADLPALSSASMSAPVNTVFFFMAMMGRWFRQVVDSSMNRKSRR